MATDTSEPIERWTAKRRVALVVSILKGEPSIAEGPGPMGSLLGRWKTGGRSFW